MDSHKPLTAGEIEELKVLIGNHYTTWKSDDKESAAGYLARLLALLTPPPDAGAVPGIPGLRLRGHGGNAGCCRKPGKGGVGMTAFDLIMQELTAAREKHPQFANSLEQSLVALASEQGELASAILKGDIDGPHGVLREAAQVAAVAIRIIEMCQHIRTCTNCGNDGPGFVCEGGHDTEGGRSDCQDWTPKQEAHHE